jgi:hypothetical protein
MEQSFRRRFFVTICEASSARVIVKDVLQFAFFDESLSD